MTVVPAAALVTDMDTAPPMMPEARLTVYSPVGTGSNSALTTTLAFGRLNVPRVPVTAMGVSRSRAVYLRVPTLYR